MPGPRWLRDFLRIAAVTLLLAELGLRALPWVVDDPLKSLIEEAGRIPLSNTRVYSGFSGGTRLFLPPPEPSDIVVVGDSVPFGTYVRAADAFPAVIEKDTGKRVINLAVGSQAPPQYNRMVEIATNYHPQLILYCVFANDLQFSPGPVIDSRLFIEKLDATERAAMIFKRISNLSRIYQLRKLMQQPAVGYTTVQWKGDGLSFVFAPAEYWDPLISWETPQVKDAVTTVASMAYNARSLPNDRHIKFAVVLLPSKEMVYGPLVGDRIYRDAHYETYRRLQKRLEEMGIWTIDVTPALRKAAVARQKLFHTIDGHLNEEGHRVVAAALRPAIQSLF